MKQVLQSLKSGDTELVDVPCPATKPAHVLIRTRTSLVSAGTERMVLAFGKGGWLSKARQQPEKVRQALHKVRTDGLFPALEAIRSRLDRPVPMGYCNVGVALDAGRDVAGVRPGDRVVSNGPHAEVVSVPQTLCVRIPDSVSDESAAFTVMGAIALQGLRLAEPTLGETFVVSGLGLVGLLAVQLLAANGCRAIGLDFNPRRLALARAFGAETIDVATIADPVSAATALTRGRGVDGALVCTATSSDEPMRQAARMSRKRGRIVLVGVAGLELARSDYYEKELSFRVSCSYGPGRYDPAYEERGRDYPLPFVRWTEQRNFEAVLDLLAARRLDVAPLVTHRFPLERAAEAYRLLLSPEPSLGVLLKYRSASDASDAALRSRTVPLRTEAAVLGRLGAGANRAVSSSWEERPASRLPRVGMIGAGNFAARVLVPAFQKAGARLVCIASEGGLSAVHPGRRHGFDEATTDVERVLNHPEIDTVVVATRHDTHAELAARALAAGRHVFVEKPLAIDAAQLARLESARRAHPIPLAMVGFNRRFAPHAATLRALLAQVAAPKTFVMTVNAGAIPGGHWTQSAEVGGGRLVGEACHFVDLLRHLCGRPVASVHATALPSPEGPADTATIGLRFADGSQGTVHYFANGHASFPKERLEIFAAGRVLVLDNFRRLHGHGWPGFRRQNLWRQDKGHEAGVRAFVDAIHQGVPSPIPWSESVESTQATFAAIESILTGRSIELTSLCNTALIDSPPRDARRRAA